MFCEPVMIIGIENYINYIKTRSPFRTIDAVISI